MFVLLGMLIATAYIGWILLQIIIGAIQGTILFWSDPDKYLNQSKH